jgi:hypothetical protein
VVDADIKHVLILRRKKNVILLRMETIIMQYASGTKDIALMQMTRII